MIVSHRDHNQRHQHIQHRHPFVYFCPQAAHAHVHEVADNGVRRVGEGRRKGKSAAIEHRRHLSVCLASIEPVVQEKPELTQCEQVHPLRQYRLRDARARQGSSQVFKIPAW